MHLIATLGIVFVIYVVWKYWTLAFGAGYDPTPMDKVRKMLETACVTESDIVYDLGCGDGRLLRTAARLHGARGVGIEIDPFRFVWAWLMTLATGNLGKVRIRFGNFFNIVIEDATVVVLFLYGPTNDRLKRKFMRELKPGTRVVSYIWRFSGWEPEKILTEDRIYLYRI